MKTFSIFPTVIAHEAMELPDSQFLSTLKKEALTFAKIDEGGIEWSRQNHYRGYTSYNSIPHIYEHSPTFEELEKIIRKRVKAYSKSLGLDPVMSPLEVDTMWINVMDHQAFHTSHIHPLSVVSGTFYVSTPKKSSQIRFEDPRYSKMMAQPLKTMPSQKLAPQVGFSSPYHFEVYPEAGDLVLFESFLRHEVPLNSSKEKRISVSFNYRLK